MIAGQVEFAVDQWLDTSGILAIIASSLVSLASHSACGPVTRVTTPSDTLDHCTDTEAINVFHLQSTDVSSIHITTSYLIICHLHIQCNEFTITNIHTKRLK